MLIVNLTESVLWRLVSGHACGGSYELSEVADNTEETWVLVEGDLVCVAGEEGGHGAWKRCS